MKKRRRLISAVLVVLVMGLLLAGCQKKEEPKEEAATEAEAGEGESEGDASETESQGTESAGSESEMTPEEELTDEEQALLKERADKRKEEYVKALRNLYENHVTPDGYDLSEEIFETDNFEDNTFAVYDVDGDGEEELIFSFTSTYMAAQFEGIYYYNVYSSEMTSKLHYTPYNEYYSNGYIKCKASHNHSLSWDFWPYTLKQYSSGAGEYVDVGSITAWDKNNYPEDYNGEPFPDDADKDGDGVVYYIYERDMYLEPEGEEPEPVDVDVMEAWLDNNLGDSLPLNIDKFKLTKYNIDQYEKGSGYITMLDEDKYTQLEFNDLRYRLPNEFIEKVDIEETEFGIEFYHKATREMAEKVFGEDVGMGRIGTLMEFSNYDFFELPHYTYIGSSSTHQYVFSLPTDVQIVPPSEYARAKEHGNEVTEEELTAVVDEYNELSEMTKDIHPLIAMG